MKQQLKKSFQLLLLILSVMFTNATYAQTGLTCSSAQSLTLSVGQTTINNVFQSSEVYWYSFTANTVSSEIELKNLQSMPKIKKLTAFTGTDCSTLTIIGSDTIANGTDSTLNLSLTQVSLGTTYFLKLEREMDCFDCGSDSANYNLLISPVDQIGCGVLWWINGNATNADNTPPTDETGVINPLTTQIIDIYLCPNDVLQIYPYLAGDLGTPGGSPFYYDLLQFNPGGAPPTYYTFGHDPSQPPPVISFNSGPGDYYITGNYNPQPANPEEVNSCWMIVVHMLPAPVPGVFTVNTVCVNECAVLTPVFPPPPQPFSVFTTNAPTNVYTTCQDGFVFNTPGTYSISMELPSQGCGSFTTTQLVTVISPTYSLTYSVEPCTFNYTFFQTVGCTGNTYTYYFDVDNSGVITNTTGIFPYTFPGVGTYTITGVTDGDGFITHTFVINVPPITPINPLISVAASSLTICAGNTVTLTASGADTYTWSTAENTNSITVMPLVTTSYTVLGTDACGTGSAVVTVTVINSPTLTISPSQTICAGQTTTLNVSGATSYTWSTSANTNSIVVSPTVTATYTVTGATACGTSTAQVTVYIAPPPIISVNNATICAGQSATLTATGGNTYVWSNGATTSSVIVSPTATVNYTVTGTTAAGCTNTAIATVSVNPSPSFIFTPSNITTATICAATNYTLIPSNVALTYSCSPAPVSVTGNSIVVNPSTTTVYTVTGTNANLCSYSKTFTVNIISVIPIAVSSTTICRNSTVTLTASNSTTSYTWSTGAIGTNTISVSPLTTTNYTVTGTTACGTSSAIATVTVFANPVVNMYGASSICSGSNATLTAFSAPPAAYSYLWNTGATTNQINVSPIVTTTYTAVVTNTSTGCSATGVKTVTVLPTPTISVTATSYTICRGSTTTLTATGATTYTWLPAGSLNTNNGSVVIASPNSSTTYTVRGKNANGCIGIQTISIIVNPLPVINSIGIAGNPNVCAGSSATLTANPNFSATIQYTWSDGSTGNPIVVTPIINTTYTVTATNTVTGCSNTFTRTVNVVPSPTLNVTASSQTICAGQNTTLTASGANNYSWNPSSSIYPPANGSSVVAHPTTSTIYTVTGSVANCSATQTIAITVNPTPTIAVTNTAICAGNSATLTASGSASSYSWSTGATNTNTISVSPTSTTTYSVIGSTAFGCTATAVTIVSVTPNPSVTVNSATICIGQSATLTANGASTYSWSTGQTTNSIVVAPTSTTDYTVIGTNLAGCTATAISNVNVLTGPSSISATASNIYPIIGTPVNISTNVTPAGSYTYVWSPNIGNTANPSFTPTNNAVYAVTISNACGTATTSLCINVESTLCGNASAVTIGTQTLSSNTTYNNTSVSITGTLTLAGANVYNFTSSIFKMSTAAKIIVEPSALLVIQGSQLFSCEGMWYGIEAQSSAAQSATISVKQSSIEDAYNSIIVNNLSSHENNYIETSNTILNKNYIDISISNTKVTSLAYSLTVLSSTMSSTASNTSPGNSLKCSGFYPAGVPLVKARSYAGLYADDAQYIEFVNNNLSVLNQVSNKDYGLLFRKTNAYVYNVQFSNIVSYRSIPLSPLAGPSLPLGVAIFHAGKEFLKAMPFTTPVFNGLLFTNVGYGIVTNKTPVVDVEQATFENPAQYRVLSTPIGSETGIGLSAVYTIDAYGILRVNQNRITSVFDAITPSYNTLTTSGSFTFSVSENLITAGVGTGTLSTGINVQGVTGVPFNGQMGDQVIAANVIKGARVAGIRLTNVQTPNGMRVSGNGIYLQSITTGTLDGIVLAGNNSNVMVDNNYIDGSLTGSPSSFNLGCSGIRSVSSPGCLIQCNTITNTGKGMVYTGNNVTGTGTKQEFANNILKYPMRRGLELNTGAVIGQQGDPTAGASGNIWDNFLNIPFVDQTFVGGPNNFSPLTNAGLSRLYVHGITTGLVERPTDNQWTGPTVFLSSYGPAANRPLTTNPGNYASCLPALQNGARIAVTLPKDITQRNADYSTYIASIVTPTASTLPQQKWLLKQYMHKAIRQTQLGNNNTVSNFYAAEQNGDAAKYFEVDSLIAINDTVLALQKNNTAPINNAIEQTHHDFNTLFLSGIKNQADYAALETIAKLCSYKYGNAVYQARALLNIVTFGNQSFEDDNCDDDKDNGRMGNFENVEQSVTLTESIQANLYPNPNDGNFTLAYDFNATESNVKLVVTDISGRLIYDKTLDDLNNMAVIKLNEVQTGIYFVQLVNENGKLLWTKKIAISK
jgi:hypothetical protein